MRQCVLYLKELFLGAPYRKSIWFLIIAKLQVEIEHFH